MSDRRAAKYDDMIIGGGIVGLSLAYELVGEGARVCVIDRGPVGRQASWAGAGLLPPAVRRPNDPPMQQLEGLSHELHRRWAEELRRTTGVDTGYRRTGSLHVATDAETARELRSAMRERVAQGVEVREVSPSEAVTIEPSLSPVTAAFLLPDECQMRNPRHLKALAAGCALRGVDVLEGVEATNFEVRNDHVEGLITSSGTIAASQYCVASGAWSGILLERLGVSLTTRPIRGQMALVRTSPTLLKHIVNQGPRYVVPRGDGRYLIGSTVEEVGFDCQTTVAGIASLLELGTRLVPALANAQLEASWAGLRPGTSDGLPYLDRVPRLANLFIAAGHFRAGLHLSTGTARVMSQLMRGVTPEIDLADFRIDRV